MLPESTPRFRSRVRVIHKLRAVQFYDRIKSVRKTAKAFGVTRKSIRSWLKKRDELSDTPMQHLRFHVTASNKSTKNLLKFIKCIL